MDTGSKAHLRWVRPEPEDALLAALARLQARGELALTADARYAGSFRAHGLLVPVWDLDRELHAKEWAEPVAAFAGALDAALADDGPAHRRRAPGPRRAGRQAGHPALTRPIRGHHVLRAGPDPGSRRRARRCGPDSSSGSHRRPPLRISATLVNGWKTSTLSLCTPNTFPLMWREASEQRKATSGATFSGAKKSNSPRSSAASRRVRGTPRATGPGSSG